jgi:DNA-binding GntR family transcriptional regulator
MDLLLAEMRLIFHRMPSIREFHDPYLAQNERIAALIESREMAAAARALTEYLAEAESQILAAYAALD